MIHCLLFIRKFLLTFGCRHLIWVLAACAGLAPFSHGFAAGRPEKMRVLIDADTANEIDDLFAIARALVAPEFDIEGITSALWQHQGSPNFVELSQALNEKLLDLAGLGDTVPHPKGAAEAMKDPRTPQDSPAARHISPGPMRAARRTNCSC